MPKAILEWQLPEEEEAFQLAARAGDYKAALDAVLHQVSCAVKHGEKSEETQAALWKLKDEIWEVVNDYRLD